MVEFSSRREKEDSNTGDEACHKITKSELDMCEERLGRECVWSDEWLNSVQEGKRKTRTRVT